MKTILSAIWLLFVAHTCFAQQQFFLKKFSLNNGTRYITNSPTVRGIVFFYQTASDTSKAVFYISDFKQSDIKMEADKVKMYKAKLCMNNYISQPGDFVFSSPSEGGMIYFYHPRPGEQPAEEFYKQ